jgi:hypothetical protein
MTAVWAGIDSGKRTHHCAVIDAAGRMVRSQLVPRYVATVPPLLVDLARGTCTDALRAHHRRATAMSSWAHHRVLRRSWQLPHIEKARSDRSSRRNDGAPAFDAPPVDSDGDCAVARWRRRPGTAVDRLTGETISPVTRRGIGARPGSGRRHAPVAAPDDGAPTGGRETCR